MRSRPDIISILDVKGREIRRNESGYLIDPEEWGTDVADAIALEEQISLTEEHWVLLRFMRDYFDEHGVAADARFAFNALANQSGKTVAQARKHYFKLFPYGHVKQLCKIAGMRQPLAWSTG